MLLKNLLIYVVNTIKRSHLFKKVLVVVGKDAPISQLEFLGLPLLVADGKDINSQLNNATKMLMGQCEALFSFASDLIFLNISYVRRVFRTASDLAKSKRRGVVIGVSKRLGCATLVQIPPGVIPFDLGRKNNLVRHLKITKKKHIETRFVFAFEGYFDVDEPEDFLEATYLSNKFPYPSFQSAKRLQRFLVKLNPS